MLGGGPGPPTGFPDPPVGILGLLSGFPKLSSPLSRSTWSNWLSICEQSAKNLPFLHSCTVGLVVRDLLSGGKSVTRQLCVVKQ